MPELFAAIVIALAALMAIESIRALRRNAHRAFALVFVCASGVYVAAIYALTLLGIVGTLSDGHRIASPEFARPAVMFLLVSVIILLWEKRDA